MPPDGSSRSEKESNPSPSSGEEPRSMHLRSRGGTSGKGAAASKKNFSSAPIHRTVPSRSTVSFATFSTGVRSVLSLTLHRIEAMLAEEPPKSPPPFPFGSWRAKR